MLNLNGFLTRSPILDLEFYLNKIQQGSKYCFKEEPLGTTHKFLGRFFVFFNKKEVFIGIFVKM